MLRVGLTGGIACGKTYVRRRMQDAGLATLDLDLVAHEVMAPGGAAYEDVLAEFGPAVRAADGTVDRAVLGARVFADPAARARLNAIVHPRVREEEDRRAAALAAKGAAVLVTDAALLVEAGFHLRFDRLVVVHCPPEEQLRRLRVRDGLDEAAARARLRAQMPVADKRAFAHFEVDTSGPFARTDTAVDAVTSALVALPPPSPGAARVLGARARAALALGPQAGPRGLTPLGLLSEIAAARGIEMERVARLLDPPVPSGDPWYRAALKGGAHGPEALAAPVALWSHARTGGDPEYTVAVAASVARLTHAEAPPIASACATALLLADALDPDEP
ncbi:MAG TPA: dephospho-CoA kinase, partial [Vicinamibacteria bacterium]|nr:dephospho-CoA kinase [Vicinamibacteria bacterium]